MLRLGASGPEIVTVTVYTSLLGPVVVDDPSIVVCVPASVWDWYNRSSASTGDPMRISNINVFISFPYRFFDQVFTQVSQIPTQASQKQPVVRAGRAACVLRSCKLPIVLEPEELRAHRSLLFPILRANAKRRFAPAILPTPN